jgi:hypothetical protein
MMNKTISIPLLLGGGVPRRAGW